jgi:hypothetical protein
MCVLFAALVKVIRQSNYHTHVQKRNIPKCADTRYLTIYLRISYP